MKMFFNIMGAQVPAYGTFIAIGILAIVVFLKTQKIYRGVDFDTSLSLLLWALCVGGVGAKLLYWITDPSSFTVLFDATRPILVRLDIAFRGGLVFLGGLIGAIVGISIFLYRHRELDPFRVFDLLAICMPILQMFGRMGCFFAGCCYGKVCESPFSVTFPENSLAPAGVPVLPTQLFGVIGNLIIVSTLLIYSQKKRPRGRVIGLYALMYSMGRFALEFFRGDEIRGIYFGLSTSQWLSIPILIMGLFFLLRKDKETSSDK